MAKFAGTSCGSSSYGSINEFCKYFLKYSLFASVDGTSHSRSSLNSVFSLGTPGCKGGVAARSVECSTPGEEVPGSISAVAARYLLVGSVSV